MVICAQCGTQNESDAKFCVNCDAFLEWEGEPAAEKSQNRQQQAPIPAPAPSRAPAPPPRPVPVQPPVPEPAVAQPSVAQPTEEERRRPPRRPPPEAGPATPPEPGDLICGQCGAGNVPTRNFCHTCGASLADVRVAPQPWWRRLLPKRGGKRYKAGSRPGTSGVRRRAGRLGAVRHKAMSILRRVLLVAVLLLGLLYAFIPGFRDSINSGAIGIKDRVQGLFVTKLDPVHPINVVSRDVQSGHQANLVNDLKKNTYWAANTKPDPTLTMLFERPVDIREAIFHIGVKDNLESTARPRMLHLVYSTGKTYDVKLADTLEPQTVSIEDSEGARRIDIQVTDVYRSQKSNQVAISEIELFQPAQR